MKLKHESLGTSVELADELLQRHVEAFFLNLRELSGGNEAMFDLSAPENSGNAIRAACEAKIILDMDSSDVENMSPASIFWLAPQIDQILREALEVPPE